MCLLSSSIKTTFPSIVLEAHSGKIDDDHHKDITFPDAPKTPKPVDLDDDLLDEMK